MIVKVCGLTRAEDADWAEKCGAEVLGYIFGVPESPRNNKLNELLQLVTPRQSARKAVLLRNAPLLNVKELLTMLRPQIFHLCGQEDERSRGEIKNLAPEIELWQTIGIPVDDPQNENWKFQLDACWNDSAIARVVLDSAKSGQSGGTGSCFSHQNIAQHLGKDSANVMIAGGLNPDNIEAILNIAPWAGVDVSSGLEKSKGQKDPKKVRQFFDNVHKVLP